jgi:hypothetical protein
VSEVEDVSAVAHERDGLRRRVKQLETENRRLRTIVSSYAEKVPMKNDDVKAHKRADLGRTKGLADARTQSP